MSNVGRDGDSTTRCPCRPSPSAAAGGTGEGKGDVLFSVRSHRSQPVGLGRGENGLTRFDQVTPAAGGLGEQGKSLRRATQHAQGSASRAARSSGVPMRSSAYSLSM